MVTRRAWALAGLAAALLAGGSGAAERPASRGPVALSAAAIQGPGERGLVAQANAMLEQLLGADALRVTGALQTRAERGSLQITYPDVSLRLGPTTELRAGNVVLSIGGAAADSFDFAVPWPAELRIVRIARTPAGAVGPGAGERTLRIATAGGAIEGRWNAKAMYPERLALALERAGLADPAATPRLQIAVAGLRIRLDVERDGADKWGGRLILDAARLELGEGDPGNRFLMAWAGLTLRGDVAGFAFGARPALGRASLHVEAADARYEQTPWPGIEAAAIALQLALDGGREPGDITARLAARGLAWPGARVPEPLLPSDVELLALRIEKLPFRRLLEAGDPGTVLNDAGALVTLESLSARAANAELQAGGTLRFSPPSAVLPLFGTLRGMISGVHALTTGLARVSAGDNAPQGIDNAFALVLVLAGLGEPADGSRYAYELRLSDTGAYRLNGIPFEPGWIEKQQRREALRRR